VSATAATKKWPLDQKQPEAAPRTRPTPQTSVETVKSAVRRLGLKALVEPANRQLLLNCSATARAEINARIERLLAADRIPSGASDA
jgi:hypothetical protein